MRQMADGGEDTVLDMAQVARRGRALGTGSWEGGELAAGDGTAQGLVGEY